MSNFYFFVNNYLNLREVAELQKANATKESRLTEATYSIEHQLKEEIQTALDKERLVSAKKQESLKWELQSARADLARLEQQHSLREDMLRKEINDLQQVRNHESNLSSKEPNWTILFCLFSENNQILLKPRENF